MNPTWKMCLLLGAGTLLLSCNEGSDDKMQVEGTIKNSTARTIYLEETSVANTEPVILDSAMLGKDGSFELSALTREESIYNLRLNGEQYPVASFINDSKEITINADVKNESEPYTVKGSPASQALKEYLALRAKQFQSIYQYTWQLDSLQKTGASDSVLQRRMAERTEAAREAKNATASVVKESKSPSLALFALGPYQSVASNPAYGIEGFNQQEINGLINETAARFPTHQGLLSIKNQLASQAQGEQGNTAPSALLNKPAPQFTLPDVNGNPVALSSFKGKYVLVDFWASWCGPCRQENPNVVQAFQQFRNKNFTILGVSLDRPGQKANWVEAIKEDQLTWTHVSDLKFWDSMVVPLYNIEGIPYNVLLDPNGVVIAENLRGPDLTQKLAQVLK